MIGEARELADTHRLGQLARMPMVVRRHSSVAWAFQRTAPA